jgi:hypothetical protein
LPVRVVPEAKAVTRLFSNDWSADRLLGERPSLASVWKAARIAVSSPTVVPEASSIVWTSFRRVCRALVNAEFDELLVEPLVVQVEVLESLELLVEPVELVELVVALLAAVVEPVEVAVEWSACWAAACRCATA